MKFLCITCDEALKHEQTRGPDAVLTNGRATAEFPVARCHAKAKHLVAR